MASEGKDNPSPMRPEAEEPELICSEEPAPWERYKPGIYDLRCTSYKLERVRMYGNSWKLRLMFQFMDTEHKERIAKFFHMGSDAKPKPRRKSEYFRAWVLANGDVLPRKGTSMSPRKFVGHVFRCEVRDVTRTIDPEMNHSVDAIYSTVAKILEVCV